jgi:hypothetical protein
MTMPAVYFSHGQESGPWGSKIKSMAATVEKLGCRAESVDYRGIADPKDRVNKLIEECAGVEEPLILVGCRDCGGGRGRRDRYIRAGTGVLHAGLRITDANAAGHADRYRAWLE